MDYFCDRCGYTTKYPGRFSIHLNKKKTCKPILKNISIESVKKSFLQNNKKKYYCQNCGYTTDDKSYFNKHINRQNSCMKVTDEMEINDIVESDNTPQFFKKVFDDNFSSTNCNENVENHINIHIVDSEDQIENIDFNLLTKKEEYSNNIEELDAIYNQLLKENNISQEENNSEMTSYQEPVIHNEIDITNTNKTNDILEIDTNNLKSNEEEIDESQFPDYSFSTSYTDIDSSMETEFKEKMTDYLNLNSDVNVINKVNNIVIHCHTPHNLDFLSNEVYTYFSQLEPGTYVLIRDEIPTFC